jgi:hypothetical protein
VLAKVQILFTEMKTFVSTPTGKTTWNTPSGRSWTALWLLYDALIQLFSSAAAVFLLAFLLRWESFNSRRSLSQMWGTIFYVPNLNSIFSRRSFDHEKEISICNDAGRHFGDGVYLARAGG